MTIVKPFKPEHLYIKFHFNTSMVAKDKHYNVNRRTNNSCLNTTRES